MLVTRPDDDVSIVPCNCKCSMLTWAEQIWGINAHLIVKYFHFQSQLVVKWENSISQFLGQFRLLCMLSMNILELIRDSKIFIDINLSYCSKILGSSIVSNSWRFQISGRNFQKIENLTITLKKNEFEHLQTWFLYLMFWWQTLSGCLRSYLMTLAVFSHPPSRISYIGDVSNFACASATCALLFALTSMITQPLFTGWNVYFRSFRVLKFLVPFLEWCVH